MTRRLLIPFLLAATALTGCEAARYFTYLFAPGSDKVAAEFAELPGKSVVIVVYCDKRVQYEYPDVCLSLSSAVAEQLAKNVKDVNVIDPRRVVKYQDGNIYWDELDKTQLGKAFGADFVLFISVVEYSTREPGSLNLYRGRITAQVSLYKTSLPEREARIWRESSIRVVHPKHDPTSLLRESDRSVRDKTEAIFADKLAKKFYDHKVDAE
jgi:hypothetical protein